MLSGAFAGGGNMSDEDKERVNGLLEEFENVVDNLSRDRRRGTAAIRSLLPCDLLIVADTEHLHVVGQRERSGATTRIYLRPPSITGTFDEVMEYARWELGFDDPFGFTLPERLLAMPTDERSNDIAAVAQAHVESELARVERVTSIVQVSPLFGPAAYPVDNRLVFVLMPFRPKLDLVYQTIVKPTVEHPEFGLACRRADELHSNKAIIQDIWKAICEARIVIADLTGLNPNVMYELGMAHTVGKDTILVSQQHRVTKKFAFDVNHIRRIQYQDSAVGGQKLKNELRETIRTILRPLARSTPAEPEQ